MAGETTATSEPPDKEEDIGFSAKWGDFRLGLKGQQPKTRREIKIVTNWKNRKLGRKWWW